MKIACLQFAPQVGDTNNNLNRADSVLNRANPEDLQELDLLVLPELSFSGKWPNYTWSILGVELVQRLSSSANFGQPLVAYPPASLVNPSDIRSRMQF